MKMILTELKNSIIATIVFAIILCGLYPLIVYGAAQLFFPRAANGSLIEGKNRRAGWLGAARPNVQRRQILSSQALGGRRGL